MRRVAEASPRRHAHPTPVARQSRPTIRAYTSNPVRIERIGTDHIQVFIRPASGEAELLLGVERIERLFDAGFDTIDVVFEASSHLARSPERPANADGADGADEALAHADRFAASGNPTIREGTR
jgi:hypothetical protein